MKHRENVRDGLVPEDYVRHLEYKNQEVALASDTKGYRFELTPLVPVTVLHGFSDAEEAGSRGLGTIATCFD